METQPVAVRYGNKRQHSDPQRTERAEKSEDSSGVNGMDRLGFYDRTAHNTKRTLVVIDPQIKVMCGMPADAPNKIVWAHWINSIHPDDLGRVKTELARLQATGVFSLRYRLIGADSIERLVEDCARMVCDGAGRPMRLRGCMRDVTPERAAARGEFFGNWDATTGFLGEPAALLLQAEQLETRLWRQPSRS